MISCWKISTEAVFGTRTRYLLLRRLASRNSSNDTLFAPTTCWRRMNNSTEKRNATRKPERHFGAYIGFVIYDNSACVWESKKLTLANFPRWLLEIHLLQQRYEVCNFIQPMCYAIEVSQWTKKNKISETGVLKPLSFLHFSSFAQAVILGGIFATCPAGPWFLSMLFLCNNKLNDVVMLAQTLTLTFDEIINTIYKQQHHSIFENLLNLSINQRNPQAFSLYG